MPKHILAVPVLIAVAVGSAVGGVPVGATTEPPGSPPDEATEESTVAAPVPVTGCLDPGPYVGPPGTKEWVEIPSSDGAIRLSRLRGDTYQQAWTEVSDPRLAGTFTRSWDEDEYFQGPAFLSIVVTTDRIENDEGAWQGSAAVWYRPDTESEQSFAPAVLVGEGAYEGLTAILSGVGSHEPCSVTGYIIEGSIPVPPVPPSDQ
jgi:hypothetical protein